MSRIETNSWTMINQPLQINTYSKMAHKIRKWISKSKTSITETIKPRRAKQKNDERENDGSKGEALPDWSLHTSVAKIK